MLFFIFSKNFKLLLISVIAWSAINFSYAQNNFEGIVSYVVDLDIKENAGNYSIYYKQKYGDTLNVYYAKNGDTYYNYNNTGELGLDWQMYIVKENKFYQKWHSMDSIFYYLADTISFEMLSFDKLEKENINGRECDQYRLKTLYVSGTDSEFLIGNWYFSDDLPIDGEIYSNYKDGRMDSLYSISNSHPIAWKLDLKYIKVSFETVNIKNMKLDQSMFKIPNDTILVKMH